MKQKKEYFTPTYWELMDLLLDFTKENGYSWVQPSRVDTIWGKRIISFWNCNGRIARYDKRTKKIFI